ncbi:MAG: hypothetical protein JRN19_02560 [Nitrososphaerota archaeon]|nr:hypothetical protein [Nitrososphaerota archaeon]MDG7049103.1 hypothetical protein [Nitrososphaerota archaeon]MDG7051316.1 hypothetical protein [Nitrososphaerota archaeon]
MIALKMGGSIITYKSRRFSINTAAIEHMAAELSRFNRPLFLVHGGGSWGHPLAIKFKLSSSSYKMEPTGVGSTRAAMLALSSRVQSALVDAGLEPFYISAQHLSQSEELIRTLAAAGVIPLSFGDVVHEDRGFRVMGGDEIIKKVNDMIHFERVIFAMDTPGVLDSYGRTIKTLTRRELRLFEGKANDATGGLAAKLRFSFELAENGADVFLLKGDEGDELLKALNGQSFHGTTVKVLGDHRRKEG